VNSNNNTIAIAYVPVLHKGYRDFLNTIASKGITHFFLVSDELLEAHDELDYIHRKDRIRALSELEVLRIISELTDLEVMLLDTQSIEEIQKDKNNIVIPAEDIGGFIVGKYFQDHIVEYENIFLRWHRDNTGEQKAVEEISTISLTDFQKEVMKSVFKEVAKSADWWRQVGAALVKEGEVLYVAHNEHMPEEQLPNIFGDTRALFKRGINIEYVTTAHAEINVIARAAREGVSTQGAELYVTDFPCPYCARAIAKSGIKKLYFVKGYAVLEGDEFLKGEGVEVIRVEE